MRRVAALSLLSALAASHWPASASERLAVGSFDTLQLRGGGSLVVVPGASQRVTIVEGSTRYTSIRMERGRKLVIGACNSRCPQNYRLRVEVQSPQVPDLAVSGGGSIIVQQRFPAQRQLSAAVRGGGRVDARAVEAGNVSAAVSGGGELLVRARSSLSGAVHGGGLVRYWGRPRVSTAISGGGAVRPGF